MIAVYCFIWIAATGMAAYFMEAHTAEKQKRKCVPFNIILPSLLVALLYIRFYETPLTVIKGVILSLTLFYAALQDIRTREVDDSVSIIIAMTALIQFDSPLFLHMLFGGIVTAFPLFMAALIKPGKLGGADIKIMATIGFLLGAEKGMIALIAGLLLAVICIPTYRQIRKVKTNAAFALVPFLAIGSYAAFLI